MKRRVTLSGLTPEEVAVFAVALKAHKGKGFPSLAAYLAELVRRDFRAMEVALNNITPEQVRAAAKLSGRDTL
jgi:hypothetical protein